LKFVADENIDRRIVERLRQYGHVVLYIAEIGAGVNDQDVLNMANKEQAVLLTADKDIGELVYRQHIVHPGVILLRLAGLLPTHKAELVARAINAHMKELVGSFVVISSRAIRLRKLAKDI
jgi:predicted nuclease of predicted toxin-antitoxin system